jgi:acetolactate synthase-1/2/3 large subunit
VDHRGQEEQEHALCHKNATGIEDQPDFVKLADAMGCVGLTCDRPEDVDAIIKKANSINDQPVVVDFRVFRDAMVWPMVAAGTSNDDIMIARELAPDWDSQEL